MPKRAKKISDAEPTPLAEPVTNIHMPISLNSKIKFNRETTATILLAVTILGLVGWSIRQQVQDWRSLRALSAEHMAVRQSGGPRVVVTDGSTATTSTDSTPAAQPKQAFSSDFELGGALFGTLNQSAKDTKEFTIRVGSNKLATFSSLFIPSIWPLRGNDLRFILQKFPTANAEFSIVDSTGASRTLLTEPDDLLYMVDKHSVSRKNDQLIYTAVTAYHETCGGEIEEKLPQFNGSVLELRATNLATGKTMVIMKNQHQPIAGKTSDLYNGVQVFGYSADGTKLYAAKRLAMGCGGMDDRPVYEVAIAPNGSVREIPFQKTITAKQIFTYVDSVSDDGKYLYYTESDGFENNSKTHRIELATGTDTIIN